MEDGDFVEDGDDDGRVETCDEACVGAGGVDFHEVFDRGLGVQPVDHVVVVAEHAVVTLRSHT